MHATEALQTSQRLRVRLGAITSMSLGCATREEDGILMPENDRTANGFHS